MIRARNIDRVTLRMNFQKNRELPLDESVIRDIIGEEKIEQIKAADQKPFFKAWVAMHEGQAFPEIVGRSAKPVHFLKSAIKSAYQSVSAAISSGLNAIFGHNDNTGKSAPKAGEIVGARSMVIDGQESFVVVGYFPESTRDRAEKVKAISVEGIVDLVDKGRNYIVDLVSSITDIALLENDAPGFAGATEAGVLRAGQAKVIYKLSAKNGEGEVMTEQNFDVPELRRMIRVNRIPVDELYDPQDIVGQKREVAGKTEWIGGSAAARSIVAEYESAIGRISQESAAKYSELEKTSGDLARKVARYDSMPMITEIAKTRKLPAEAMVDLELERDAFNPDPSKDLKVQSEAFVESVAQKFQKRQEALKQSSGQTQTQKTGDGIARPEGDQTNLDMSKPENNPLIPR